MLLLGDGSHTRNLQLLTGEPVEVDVIDMSVIGTDPEGAPEIVKVVPNPWMRRQVWLQNAAGQRLTYAASWWEASHLDEYLENRSLPIWTSLARSRTELYRDIQGIHYGHSPALETAFLGTALLVLAQRATDYVNLRGVFALFGEVFGRNGEGVASVG
jgi:chorismate lyase